MRVNKSIHSPEQHRKESGGASFPPPPGLMTRWWGMGQRPRHSVSWSPKPSLRRLSSPFPSCNEGQHSFIILQLTLLHRLIYFSWIQLVKKFQGQEPSYFQINLSPLCFPVTFLRKWEIRFVSDQVIWLTQERSKLILLQLLPWVGPVCEPKFFQLSQWDGSSKEICQILTLVTHYLLSVKASFILSLPKKFSLSIDFFVVVACFPSNSWSSSLNVFGNLMWCSTLYLTHTFAHKYVGDCSAVLQKFGAVSSFFGA